MAVYHIARDGESEYHISAHQYADETVRFAASELQKYILRASGTVIPYFSDRCPARGPEIRVGPDVRGVPGPALAPEEYRISGDGRDIRIEGGSSRGVLYGVYEFLERFCGLRRYTKDAEKTDVLGSLDIELDEINGRPAFEYREVYFRNAFDGDFCAKNRLNSNMGDISRARGGRMKWFNFHHSFRDLVQPEIYFDSHPEYYSEIDGERVKDSQLCLTNPEVLEIAKNTLERWIEENPECTVFSVGQNDNRRYCRCPACAALGEKEGSPSGPIIHFVNALADSIKDSHPGVLLHTFAYTYSLPAPTYAVARDNVIVRLCSISCRLDKPLTQLAAENPGGAEDVFISALRDWKNHAKRLYVWDYAVNFANYLQPLIHLGVMRENLRLYRAFGVLGVLEQGNFAYGGGASMDDYKSYIAARLLWDPDADIESERRGFMKTVFGEKAGAYMEEYAKLMESAGRAAPLSIYQFPDADYITDELIEKADGLFRLALGAAENGEFRDRVSREYLAVRYLTLTRMPLDAPGREGMIKEFFRDVKARGLTEIMERRSLACSERWMLGRRYTKERPGAYSLYYIMQ